MHLQPLYDLEIMKILKEVCNADENLGQKVYLFVCVLCKRDFVSFLLFLMHSSCKQMILAPDFHTNSLLLLI